jgi:hypothetical protein
MRTPTGSRRRSPAAFARHTRVPVVSVGGARYEHVGRYNLIVVGGPTHAHGMSRPNTPGGRHSAPRVKAEPLNVEPDAGGVSLRVWLDTLGLGGGHAAAFDTRLRGYAFVTGRASKGIAAMLRQHGFELVVEPISFLVDRHDHLLPVRRSGPSVGVPLWARNGKSRSWSLSGLIIWATVP